LTLLALTLFGGAGAWAQAPTNVTQFTTDLIASWATDNHPVTLADLQAIGFEAVAENTAGLWTGAPQGNLSYLFYGFNEGEFYYIEFEDGTPVNQSSSVLTKSDFYLNVVNGFKYFYTGSPEPAAIKLTPDATGKVWTLAETPDYDLDLNVVYYQPHALKEIPTGWQVKVDGVDKTDAIDHDSLMIVETAQVILTPDHPERVKKVILVDEAPAVQTVTVDGLQINYVEGENWVQTAERNPALDISGGHIFKYGFYVLMVGGSPVSPTDTYNSSLSYYWQEY